jgi:hypothetical protein
MLSLGLFIACVLAGMVNSVAGGGIFVVFPALLAAGLPPITANTTSNLVSWPGALSSAYGYRAHLRKLPRKYLLLLIPCLIGAVIGAVLLAQTDSSEFTKAVPWLVLLAVMLFIFQPFLHRHLERNLATHRNAPLIAIGLALLPMSIYGGYFGAGFGFLMLAFLGFTRITNLHQINGLKNLASATITIVCTIYFGLRGMIDWEFAPVMIVGSLIGGLVGAHFAQKIHEVVIHYFIIILGLVVAAALFLKP